MAALRAVPAAGGGPPNPAHLPLFTVLSAYADALDALPLDLTRSFSDLRELDAVLGTHLSSLTARLHTLAAALSNPDLTPGQRLIALKDCAEEARAYKEGGEDKIRVAVNTAETIASHTDFIDRLSNGILASTIPELAPALRPASGRFLHHARIPYDKDQDRYMEDTVTEEDLPDSYNDVDYAIAVLKAQAAANGELTGSSKSSNALASRFNLNLQAGGAGSSFGMLGPSFHTHHGAGAAAAAASTAQVLRGPDASGSGFAGTSAGGNGDRGGSGAGSASGGGHHSNERGAGAGSSGVYASPAAGSSSKKSSAGAGGGGGSGAGSKRSAAAAGLVPAHSATTSESRHGGSGSQVQPSHSVSHSASGSHSHQSSSHRAVHASGHGNAGSQPTSYNDRHASSHAAPGSNSRSSHSGSASVHQASFAADQHSYSQRSHSSHHNAASNHPGSGSGSNSHASTSLHESSKSSSSAAARAAAAVAAGANTSTGDDQEDQTRYCYCQQVSYGEMIACDSRDCPFEWFHLVCANLTEAPPDGTKWYCDHCLEKRARKKGKAGARRAR
ncbi:hypothetical protein V8E36_001658 [Tilletia maclaganii]